jgi:hypothetical protein
MSENKSIVEKLYKAYVYGYPLVVLDLQKTTLTNTVEPDSFKAPINQLIHAKSTAGSDDKYIVMLNMDTVYSQIYFDLKDEPVYFKKPKTDRYATALLLDAYGNSVDILGTGATGGNDEVNAVLVGPDYKGDVPEGLTRIDMPTNLCWSLIRVILNHPEDAENVAEIQNQFDARPLHAYGRDYIYPKGIYKPENDYVTFEKINSISIEEFFSIFNKAIGDNLGSEPDYEILNAVEEYGVGAGKKFSLDNFTSDVQAELVKFNDRLRADFAETSARGDYGVSNNGWIFPRDTIAHFGKEYMYRANVAWGGIGANPVSMAMYPTAVSDLEGKLLHSDNDYIIHFASLPPVNAFWSLTAYGDDKFQIPNEINRYGINDRSVFNLNEDGSFDIYVQRNRPSEDKLNNWLPSGEVGFCLVLRLYLPQEEILNGTWPLPEITKA